MTIQCSRHVNSSPIAVDDNNRELCSFEIQFESDDTDYIRIRFEIKIFESAAPAVVPQTTLTVMFYKKNFNRCAVVIETILCL